MKIESSLTEKGLTADMIAKIETLEFLANEGYKTLKIAINAKHYKQSQAYNSMANEFYRVLGNELKFITGNELNSKILVTDEDILARYNLQYNITWHIPQSIKHYAKQAHVINDPINAHDIKEVLNGEYITSKLTLVPETENRIANYGDICYFSVRLEDTGKLQDILKILDYVRKIHPKLWASQG